MSGKRIAMLIWKDGVGGAERSLTDFASALDRNRFDIQFYYLSGEPGYFAKKIENLGYKTIYLKWENGYDMSGRIRLIKHLKGFKPHIIHDHIVPPLTRFLLKLLIRKPIINTEHGMALQRMLGIGGKWRKIVERLDFMCCDYVAANSAASADALKKVYHLSESKVRIIHLGIDTDHFKPDQREKSSDAALIIGYVGRIINNHKGVDQLPLVAKILREHYKIGFKIIVAGDGPDRNKTEQICKDADVEKYFEFLGWISDVKSFLNRIDVLIVPSRYEPLGLTAMEALAMNVPVVAFDVQGLREILAECPIGKLIRPGDINGMAEEINSIYRERVDMGDTGRDYVKKRFSNHLTARQYEAVYNQSIN